jgi:hypothetical protein
MTGIRAVDLQAQWRLLADPPTCEHCTLELERDDTGSYLSGVYYCTICGEVVVKKQALVTQTSQTSDTTNTTPSLTNS